MDANAADRLVAAFQDDFYIAPEAVAEAIVCRSLFNVIHNETVIKVDLILLPATPFHHSAFARRTTIDLDGHLLQLIAAEDLILAKLQWAKRTESELQLRDVKNLLAHGTQLDREYLHRWIPVLQLETLWARMDS
ncbi:MAG: hypothetical protein HY696_07760 [Deltaproteobacteria bacterium]|nr:hypothetical protein [Deltaproteobacteria bacterium]